MSQFATLSAVLSQAVANGKMSVEDMISILSRMGEKVSVAAQAAQEFNTGMKEVLETRPASQIASIAELRNTKREWERQYDIAQEKLRVTHDLVMATGLINHSIKADDGFAFIAPRVDGTFLNLLRLLGRTARGDRIVTASISRESDVTITFHHTTKTAEEQDAYLQLTAMLVRHIHKTCVGKRAIKSFIHAQIDNLSLESYAPRANVFSMTFAN